MKSRLKKMVGLFLLFACVGIFSLPASAGTDARYTLSVGDTKYLYTNAGGRALVGAAWTSSDYRSVEIVEQSDFSCKIKVNSYTSKTPVVIHCLYYYNELFRGYIYQRKDYTDYYITVIPPSGNEEYQNSSSSLRETLDYSNCWMDKQEYAYSGQAVKPAVYAKNKNRQLLTEGKDYMVNYSDNVNPGKATVKITGIGKYTGTIYKNFWIKTNQELKISISSRNITAGETAQITVEGQGKISYTSGNSAVATVDAQGTVKGISEGTAEIKVSAAGSETCFSASGTITVTVSRKPKNPPEAVPEQPSGNGPSGQPSSGTSGQSSGSGSSGQPSSGTSGQSMGSAVPGKQAVRLSKTSAVLCPGQKLSLHIENASGMRVFWYSSDSRTATVSSQGEVTARRAGKAAIYAKVNGRTLICKVEVKKVLSVSRQKVTIFRGGKQAVTVTFRMSGSVKYRIANTRYISCKWKGFKGDECELIIEGKRRGRTTLQISNSYNNEKINIQVFVK